MKRRASKPEVSLPQKGGKRTAAPAAQDGVVKEVALAVSRHCGGEDIVVERLKNGNIIVAYLLRDNDMESDFDWEGDAYLYYPKSACLYRMDARVRVKGLPKEDAQFGLLWEHSNDNNDVQ